ncbi:MAG: hypothetical protein J6B64_02500 [Bacilli bacterium]|nr:hypothetical protein [Bacilli bacterium]
MDKKNLEEIKKCILNKDYITDEMYIDYIISEVINRDLIEYIKEVEFDDDKICEFNNQEKLITINPNEILYENGIKGIPDLVNVISRKEQRTGKLKDKNNYNLYNYFIINHEIEHANQVKLLNRLNPKEHLNEPYIFWRFLLLIKEVLLENNSIIYLKDMPYKVYHDYYISEYDANINSYINTLNFLNNLDLREINTNIEKFNTIIAKNLLYLYRDIENKRKLSTPSKNFIKLHNHVRRLLESRNIYNPENFFDIYRGIEKPSLQIERLKLGFQISKDTYEYLTLVSKEKHKTLNLFNDIMNL